MNMISRYDADRVARTIADIMQIAAVRSAAGGTSCSVTSATPKLSWRLSHIPMRLRSTSPLCADPPRGGLPSGRP
jgi:hypothetical protein